MSHDSRTVIESSSISNEDDSSDDDQLDLSFDSDEFSIGEDVYRISFRPKESKKNLGDEFGRTTVQEEKEEEAPKENLRRAIQDLGPNRLDMLGAVEVATVLEELSDKLDIISTSIDTPPIDIRRQRSIISDTTLHRPELHIPPVLDMRKNEFSQDKWILTQHYRSVIPRRLQLGGEQLENITAIRKDPTYLLRLHGIKKFTDKGKIQSDRTHTQVAVDRAVAELIQNSTFHTFTDAIAREEFVMQEKTNMVQRRVENAERIVQLKKEKKKVRRDKVTELTAMDQAIYMLHDGTQEMMKRKELESVYVRTFGAMMVNRSEKVCKKLETVAETELADISLTVIEEDRSHESMTAIIKAKLTEAEERLDYWMEKYEVDKDTLQNELDTMKANRVRDLKRIAWLKATIYNYSQICRDDRRIKSKLAEEERLYRLRIKKSIKIQAWWRGEMVRKKLGAYRPAKPGKKKEEGGKGKKKK